MSGIDTPRGALFSPRQREARDTFSAEVVLELSRVDGMFRYPTTKAITPQAAMREVAPEIQYVGDATRPDEHLESGADSRLMFRTGRGSDVYIYEKGDQLWLDLSHLAEGEGGSGIYSAMFDYAASSRRCLIGDPAGLSDIALRRRTEAMLSSAIKHASTDHMEPHPRQIEGDEVLGVPPLAWQLGDTLGNVQRMIDVSLLSLTSKMPEVQNDRYDFGSRAFRTGEGEPLTERTLQEWGHSAAGSREAGAGGATLKRAIFLNSLVRASGGARPGLLEQVLRQPRQLVGHDAQSIF